MINTEIFKRTLVHKRFTYIISMLTSYMVNNYTKHYRPCLPVDLANKAYFTIHLPCLRSIYPSHLKHRAQIQFFISMLFKVHFK